MKLDSILQKCLDRPEEQIAEALVKGVMTKIFYSLEPYDQMYWIDHMKVAVANKESIKENVQGLLDEYFFNTGIQMMSKDKKKLEEFSGNTLDTLRSNSNLMKKLTSNEKNIQKYQLMKEKMSKAMKSVFEEYPVEKKINQIITKDNFNTLYSGLNLHEKVGMVSSLLNRDLGIDENKKKTIKRYLSHDAIDQTVESDKILKEVKYKGIKLIDAVLKLQDDFDILFKKGRLLKFPKKLYPQIDTYMENYRGLVDSICKVTEFGHMTGKAEMILKRADSESTRMRSETKTMMKEAASVFGLMFFDINKRYYNKSRAKRKNNIDYLFTQLRSAASRADNILKDTYPTKVRLSKEYSSLEDAIGE